MKKPINPGLVPFGGFWRFRDPDTGQEIAHPYYVQVKARAHAARVKAGLPIPFDWDDWFDDQLCQRTPQGCYEVTDIPPEPAGSRWLKMSGQFMSAMVEWGRAGFPVVGWEEFKRRMAICAGEPGRERCPLYHPSGAFSIARCGKCGCTSLKLHLATSKCPIGKW